MQFIGDEAVPVRLHVWEGRHARGANWQIRGQRFQGNHQPAQILTNINLFEETQIKFGILANIYCTSMHDRRDKLHL